MKRNRVTEDLYLLYGMDKKKGIDRNIKQQNSDSTTQKAAAIKPNLNISKLTETETTKKQSLGFDVLAQRKVPDAA